MRLAIDQALVAKARSAARQITGEVQQYIAAHTTTSIERTVVRLLGVDGVDADGVPLPNRLVDAILALGGKEALGRGAAWWLANAVTVTGQTAQDVAAAVATGALDLGALPPGQEAAVSGTLQGLAGGTCDRIAANRRRREALRVSPGMARKPWFYVIVATGNIHEDIVQAKAAVKQGADIIAVIRTTAQSLLDYVPYGVQEGYGGTPATQANFRLMRAALDEVGTEVGRYIMQVNYCSGLCMPEIAAIGALEGLDMMLNDAMYGILFRDINMERTFVDQFFSRMINAYAGIIINTGEDNYMTVDDPLTAAHTVLASQFINEQFALRSGLPPQQIGLGHVFSIGPGVDDGLLLELAQAQLTREVFPDALLKYMPPTKASTGNIFLTHLVDGLFTLAAVLTGQDIQLLGMLTEAVHTPHIHDRYLALEGARYIANATWHLRHEVSLDADGRIASRAHEVLAKAGALLAEIAAGGLWDALAVGKFAGISRTREGGKGRDGVVPKGEGYLNPFLELMGPGRGPGEALA